MDMHLAQDHVKAKRTKRPRAVSPFMLSMTSSSSSAGEIASARINTDHSGDERAMAASSTISNGLTMSTEDEEDMANCLILLAGGKRTIKSQESRAGDGLYGGTYQCKTCNKCFSSFQALGGHRASHKKPKTNSTTSDQENQKNKALSMMLFEDQDYSTHQFNHTSTVLSLNVPNGKFLSRNDVKCKVHECSICGAEFSSGQALGGHMRRHRSILGSTSMSTTSTSISGTPESKKSRNMLQLDLNLPAPEDDQQEFSFVSNKQVLSFSSSPLVGCHY